MEENLEKWQEKIKYEYFQEDQRAAYSRLTQEQKDRMWSFKSGDTPNTKAMINYLLAPEEDRALFDSGKMNEFEQSNFLKIGSSRVMRIFSDGYVKFKQLMTMTSIGIPVALVIALGCVGIGIYCETYMKNKEIMEAINKDDGKATAHFGFNPEMVGKIDNHAEMIGVTQNLLENTKTLEQYKSFVSAVIDPNTIQCETIGNLDESFMSSKTHLPIEPRCKKDNGNVWLESYVASGPGEVKPVFGVFHQGKDGKWQYSNFDLKDFGLDTAKLDGVQTLDENKVPSAFTHAFPEMQEQKKNEETK
ncbi:MAG TPA: hypothetical protein VM577_02245 [Anaerovoracaceae bacterium]|nr:hypothetical protein [Anaerovoracaceae bacterium]